LNGLFDAAGGRAFLPMTATTTMVTAYGVICRKAVGIGVLSGERKYCRASVKPNISEAPNAPSGDQRPTMRAAMAMYPLPAVMFLPNWPVLPMVNHTPPRPESRPE
jgi:hypothetical protein